uniref:Slc7a-2 n=1 Tax=Schmidtea mediterranea TaxID=79327 RepID=A0A0H3YIV9_SCHMD|nr:slc7a-2 [Schmidtea mediterranea]
MKIKRFFMGFFRKKTYIGVDLNKSLLARCLTTLDLTALGIGATLGAGVYVVAGKVAKESAGPSVVVSFLIAAIASIFAGLCYAEFGARVPRTGSAYIYSYVSVGELMAFIIGWNLILEYVIGTASVARAWSSNFDEIIGGHIKDFFNSTMPMNLIGLAPYPDLFAFLITVVLTSILCIGVKESSRFNNIFTVLNVSVILYVIICGFWNVDIKNWKIPPKTMSNGTIIYNPHIGSGYFFPFGISGMLSGAGTCFYAFVGFDSIATTGEEVINPQKAIPFAIIFCLSLCFVAYASISTIITLMCPFYIINEDAPLPFIFDKAGWYVSKYIVGIGALFGLSTSLLGALFPLPRIIYAMSSDGLLFAFLSKINKRFKTPLVATAAAGLLAATMSALFDLKSLVDMMSIGTLLAYTLVAFSILLLRGSVDSINVDSDSENEQKSEIIQSGISFREYRRNILKRRSVRPSMITGFISKFNSYCLIVSIFILDLLLVQDTLIKTPALLFFIILFIIWIIFLCITLFIQPENQKKISFKVPGVPWLPAISILINLYLMLKLPVDTWYRFGIWMAVGFLIYFFYGLSHSKEGKKNSSSNTQLLFDNSKVGYTLSH